MQKGKGVWRKTRPGIVPAKKGLGGRAEKKGWSCGDRKKKRPSPAYHQKNQDPESAENCYGAKVKEQEKKKKN